MRSSTAGVPTCVLLVDSTVDYGVVDQFRASGLCPGVVVIRVQSHLRGGIDTVQALRATRVNAAIVVVGSVESVDDRVAFFESGADHVLDASLTARELVAWTRAILRRQRAPQRPVGSTQGLVLQREYNIVERLGLHTALTPTEFDLLAVLADSDGRVVPRRHLLMLVWGIAEETTTNVLNAHIWSLRRKLGSIGASHALQTVRGVGFALADA
ncbi:response regulator transcription factor [Rhodococcus wratislaviensis]|uniref:response regulator transcription factor n=1 Tax=Rhodococcus wratislaviensis TaxID=44752 RepID=UPI00365F5E3C